MNLTKSRHTASIRRRLKGKKKAKSKRRYTEQAWARVCQGRPPKYPEAAPLARRCGVTLTHAIHVLAGRRKSEFLMAELVKMRAEAAGQGGVK